MDTEKYERIQVVVAGWRALPVDERIECLSWFLTEDLHDLQILAKREKDARLLGKGGSFGRGYDE